MSQKGVEKTISKNIDKNMLSFFESLGFKNTLNEIKSQRK